MKGIRGRLTANFVIVIVITVAVLEVLLIYTVRQNFYGTLQGSLSSQIKISADMYSKYFSETSLEDNVLYNVDAFWNQNNARVEIADRQGNIIMDSQGAIPQEAEKKDIQDALAGNMGVWVGEMNGQKVMAVSYPLRSDNQIVGALRLIASTAAIDQDISSMAKIFSAIGLFVVLAVGLLSIFLANTILVPLREVTLTAQKMALGDFQIRSKKVRDDEIGNLSDTLNYLADEIVKREQLKNDFISSVSHELRTPLTSIMGWAITLQNENFQRKETLSDGLGIIAKESKRLTQMVEELLDFSKFVSGRIELRKEAVDLTNLIEQMHKQLTPRAVRENIGFTVRCPEHLPTLYTDANRLKQLFINILDNAFNFTSTGGSVDLEVEATEEAIRFTITDTGCGIGPEELPMVKEKFYKGKSSRSQNGIGLSISEEIVQLMGGRLEINSELNKGTSVVVTLPREEYADG